MSAIPSRRSDPVGLLRGCPPANPSRSMAAADGSNLEEVFSRAGKHSGTPRWSPDSRRIAFDSTAEGNFDIYVIELGSARTLRLTADAADDAIPNWSPDGTWIYFASNRTARQEVWKVRRAGGPAEQVTHNGGACVYPSTDGTHIYYTKHDGDAELWTVPVAGGEEHQVLPSVLNRAFVRARRWDLFHSTIKSR